MSIDDSLHRMSAAQLTAGLKKGAFSAAEVCEASIARIERLDADINAVIVKDYERARAEARLADEAIARGQMKPLNIRSSIAMFICGI